MDDLATLSRLSALEHLTPPFQAHHLSTATQILWCRLRGLDDLAALSRLPALEHLVLACKWLAKAPPPAPLPLPPALTFLALSGGVARFLGLAAERGLSQLAQLRHLYTLQLEAWCPSLNEASMWLSSHLFACKGRTTLHVLVWGSAAAAVVQQCLQIHTGQGL